MSLSPTNSPPITQTDSWENEGGSMSAPETAEHLGMIRHVTETYTAGEFRYTSLTDAIAQARRMTKT